MYHWKTSKFTFQQVWPCPCPKFTVTLLKGVFTKWMMWLQGLVKMPTLVLLDNNLMKVCDSLAWFNFSFILVSLHLVYSSLPICSSLLSFFYLVILFTLVTCYLFCSLLQIYRANLIPCSSYILSLHFFFHLNSSGWRVKTFVFCLLNNRRGRDLDSSHMLLIGRRSFTSLF